MGMTSIIPVRMVKVVDAPFPKHVDNSATSPLDVPVESSKKEFTYYSKEEFSKESTHAIEELYEKWQEIKFLKLDWVSETKRRVKERKKRREQRAKKLQKKQTPPSFAGKINFLLEVKAYDVAKSNNHGNKALGVKQQMNWSH